ncbi:hypothetical protein [Microbacterium testaceum]|uniref:hypothetical protein n=1 Tax=Microbacterium testaceum TaxID=2033 RepID=UPI002ACC2BB8|nr:hypothetical protein [Microbacterium testaceum]
MALGVALAVGVAVEVAVAAVVAAPEADGAHAASVAVPAPSTTRPRMPRRETSVRMSKGAP